MMLRSRVTSSSKPKNFSEHSSDNYGTNFGQKKSLQISNDYLIPSQKKRVIFNIGVDEKRAITTVNSRKASVTS